MPNFIGKEFTLMWGDEEIAKITDFSCNIEELERDVVDWQKEVSGTVSFEWGSIYDSTMFIRMMAEMYAEQFQN